MKRLQAVASVLAPIRACFGRHVLLIAALLLLGRGLPAQAAFDDLGAGARAPGMGGAFVPVADDVYTIYYNPAGLGTLERPQFGTSYTKLYSGLSDGSDINTTFIGYAHPIADGARGTLATAWNSFSLNNSLYRDQSFYLSYGKLFLRTGQGDLYGGVSLKYLQSSFGALTEAKDATQSNTIFKTGLPDPVLANNKIRRAFDADLGLLYRLGKHYSVGFQAMHVPQPNVAFSAGDKDKLPLNLKLGVNYRSLISNLVAQVETSRSPSGPQDAIFTIAAERWFPRLFIGDFGARGGMNIGSRDYKQLTLGLSFRSKRVQVDYGFELPINTIDKTAGSHKMAISFRFGRPTDEEESLELVLEAMRQLKYGGPITLRKPQASGMTKGQQATLEEYLAQAQSAEASAQYKEALDKMGLAMTVAPPDKDFVARFGRLNFVGQQIKSLPQFKTDPMQATLHQGLLAYLSGNDLEAVRKVSEALSLKPGYKELDVFLSQLELITGLKRLQVASKQPKDYTLAVTLTRANSAIEERKYREAIELSLEVIRHEEANASAWENLGTAYFALKEYDDSYKAWEKAYSYETSPSVRSAIKGYLKSIARIKERRRSAKTSATETVPLPERPKLSPEEVEKLYNEGIDAYIRRDLERAKKAFEQILEADPRNVEAQKALRRVRDELP